MSNAPIQHPVVDIKTGIITQIWARWAIGVAKFLNGGSPSTPNSEFLSLRSGTAAQWTSENPVLRAGELGFENDTFKIKCGNGVLDWASLPYI